MRDFVARGAIYKINQQDDFCFKYFSQEVLLPVERLKEILIMHFCVIMKSEI